MRVLVVGGGGREHALARGLFQSSRVTQVICAPGNAGTASLAENVAVDAEDIDGLLALAEERDIDLTVVGPEAPLCAGIVDRFQKRGHRIFGPTAAAARIEGDKAYAKQLMKTAKVPTGEARIFKHYNSAREYVATRDTGVVVKAAGLAAGKGVFVCPEPSDGLLALEEIMIKRSLGAAGDKVVVEELLKGPELSVFALVQGHTILVLDTAQDHKAVGEGDTGPNTGGMGAYSPAPIATREVLSIVERDVLVPIVDAMRNDGAEFSGLLYCGLMLTPAGPKVLEFNCRFGDPETQALLMRLDSDLFDLLGAVVDGKLEQAEVRWNPRSALCVVVAAGGYPGKYERGLAISGLDSAADMPDVYVYHAGTKTLEIQVVTSGGRVLGVTALGDDIASAQRRAYEAVDKIKFDGAYCRRDIGYRAIGATAGAE